MEWTSSRSAQGLAEAERLEVHSIYPFHPHEAVHVYSALIGRPSDFFNEGLAVAFANDPLNGSFDGRYSNQPVHPWARQNQALLRPIEETVTTDAFRQVPDAISYPQAGSFVEFLVEAEGCAAVRELFRRGRLEDTLDTIRAAFQASFGFSLAEAESRWRAFLTSGVAPALGAGPSTRCVAVRGSSWHGLGPRRPQTPGAD